MIYLGLHCRLSVQNQIVLGTRKVSAHPGAAESHQNCTESTDKWIFPGAFLKAGPPCSRKVVIVFHLSL